MKRRVAILDRDGTLVELVRHAELGVVSAYEPNELRFLPGVFDGLALLVEAGFLLAIATNQPGAAKGQASIAAIARTNDAVRARLAHEGFELAAFEVCLHHPDGGMGGDRSLVGPCACRKPEPGMLTAIVAALDADKTASWMIGDSALDVEAARRAGLRSARVHAGVDTSRAECAAERFDQLCRLLVESPPG